MTPKTQTVLIGNPGVGKSSILNTLIQEPKFRSGISIGKGLTSVLQREEDKFGNIWMDTPGLSDINMRRQAADEIEKALRMDGFYKIVFVLTIEAGRIRPDDIATMCLIHEACPTIGTNYAIIVNKVSKRVLEELNKEHERSVFQASLNLGLPGTSFVYFLGLDLDAMDLEDATVALPNDFVSFMISCPTVHIKSSDMGHIAEDQFGRMKEEFAATLDSLKKSNEELQNQINIQQDRYLKETEKYQQAMTEMQRSHKAEFDEMVKQQEALKQSYEQQMKLVQQKKRGGLFGKIVKILLPAVESYFRK